jgi:tetratricopeptide (TPR) repeat protein
MRRAAVLLLPITLAGCLLNPVIRPSQLAGWNSIEIGTVSVAGDLPAEEIERFGRDLALFSAAFAKLAGSPEGGGVPARVFLIRDPKLARRFHLEAGGIAGWALPTLDGHFCVVAVQTNRIATRGVLYHEYTHVLLRRGRRAPVPPWYDEGLASFFETLHGRGDAVVVGAAQGTDVAFLASGGSLPLEELFEGDIWSNGGRHAQAFYATSWGLSHYLLLSPQGRGEMSRLVAELARGEPPAQAQSRAFGRSTAALETELRAHLSHLSRGVPAEVLLDARDLVRPELGRSRLMASSDLACELGRLALATAAAGDGDADPALAAKLLETAAGAGSLSARCEAALAEARALQGDENGARGAASRALARAPEDPDVRLRAGRVELAHAEGAEGPDAAAAGDAAEAHFRAALALDERSASAWFGLGQSLERAGDPEGARNAFETARRLGWSPELDLALGRLELASGRRERAFALLRPLAQDPHGGPASQEAARLLEGAGLRPEAPARTQ